jgi:uncharacterized protein (DUF433 family)
MRALPFVPHAEAVFIAGISDRQLDRVVDERLVPDALLDLKGPIRRYARLVAPFARFYFETEPTLVAAARRDVVKEVFRRVQKLRTRDSLLALTDMPADFNWKVGLQDIEVDLSRFVAQAYVNARKVDEAEALVLEDAEIMGGLPCFTGTRVPISNVLGALDEGMTRDETRQDYPFLTDAHVAAARVYAEVHPRRGRPRRLRDVLGQPRETIAVRNKRACPTNS